jgi:hypothetical protein
MEKASVIMVGWMPFTNSFWHAPRKEPHSTTTDVVPSPGVVVVKRRLAWWMKGKLWWG